MSDPAMNGLITWREAERRVGRKLNRRRTYAIVGDDVCEIATWTSACSGCSEGRDYAVDEIGAGCTECGFTGKRRTSMWVPVVKS